MDITSILAGAFVFALGYFCRTAYISYTAWTKKHPGPEVPLTEGTWKTNHKKIFDDRETIKRRGGDLSDMPDFPSMPDFPKFPDAPQFPGWPTDPNVTKLREDIAELKDQLKNMDERYEIMFKRGTRAPTAGAL